MYVTESFPGLFSQYALSHPATLLSDGNDSFASDQRFIPYPVFPLLAARVTHR